MFAGAFLPNGRRQTTAAGMSTMDTNLEDLSIVASVTARSPSVVLIAVLSAGACTRSLAAAMIGGASPWRLLLKAHGHRVY